MCLETACRLIVNGSASSFTVASPAVRRVTIARRVGSAKAEKAASSRSSVSVTSYEGRQEPSELTGGLVGQHHQPGISRPRVGKMHRVINASLEESLAFANPMVVQPLC